MPCKENIKQQLTSIIQKESNAGFSMPLDKAIQLAKEVNAKYNSKVLWFRESGVNTDKELERVITVDNLANVYYNNELKLEEQEARNQQQIDAERASENYNDRYLFDDLVASNETNHDGFNYVNYMVRKETLKKSLENKITILSNKAEKNKEDLEQIEEIKEVVRKLSKDLKNLESEDAVLANYFNYFTKDMEIISDLLDRPTLENLSVIKDYIDAIEVVTTTGPEGFLKQSVEEMERITKDTKLSQSFYDFKSELEILKSKYNDKEVGIIKDEIKKHLRNTKEGTYTEKELEEKVISLYQEQIDKERKDISTVDAYLNTADSLSGEILHKVLFKTFGDSMARSSMKDLREKLSNIKPKLVSELKNLGYENNQGFIGKLYNPVVYDVFKKKTKDGTSKLIGKFSSSWTTFKEKIEKSNDEIKDLEFKKGKDKADYNKINTLRNKQFEDLKNNVDFIDVTRIPELIEDPDLQENFGAFFDSEESESYKQSIIDSVGQREYEKIVKEQKEKIYSFQISTEQYKNRLLKIHGVSEITKIPEAEYNKFLDSYYTKSPFAFSESFRNTGTNKVTKIYFDKGQTKENANTISDLEYVSYLPKNQNQNFFDKDFKDNIESNPILYEAWTYMADSLRFINQNGHNSKKSRDTIEDSLIKQRDAFQANLSPGKNYISLLSEKTLDWINNVFSTSKFRDTSDSTKLQINGQIRTIDQEVTTRLKPLLVFVKSKYKGVKLDKKVPFKTLSPSLQRYLEGKTGKTEKELSQEVDSVENILRKSINEKISSEQELDLVESILSQVETVEKFKARREVETTVKFLQNKIRNIKISKDNDRKRAVEIADFFVQKQLYGVNNRANFNKVTKQNADFWKKVYTQEEKEMRETLVEVRDSLVRLQDNSPEVLKEIKAIENMLDSGGRVITTGSILEATILKLARFKAFALNFSTQTKNYVMGDFNAIEVDGKAWTEGNYYKAKSYTRKWKIATRGLSENNKKNHMITSLLLNRLQVFQNSANEIFKVEESSYKQTIAKIIANPMQLPGEVEKTIQRPQILAVLGDIKIKDKSGNEVPAFDLNNLDNPHPAFDVNKDGGLSLKPEFDTEDNHATWILNNSQEYANLFGDSGKLPKTISYVNGDYRDSSSYLFEKSMGGSIAFMFKRWFPATVLKKFGVYNQLATSGELKEAAAVTNQSALVFGLNAGTFLGSFGLAAGIGAYAASVGKGMHAQAIKENKKFLSFVTKELTKTLLDHKFYLRNAQVMAGGSVKAIQLMVNPLVGSNFITNDLINKVSGFDKLKGTQAQVEASQKNLQFLMTTFAKTLIFTALRIAIHSALYPEDDEKKAYDKKDGFYERLGYDPDTTLFYILENTLSSLTQDTNLMFSPQSLLDTALPLYNSRSIKDLVKLSNVLDDQALDGDYKAGENAGKNKVLTVTSKMFLPSAYDNMSLGFNNVSKQDFNPKDYISSSSKSEFDKINSKRKSLRAIKRNELNEKLKKTYPDKSTRNKKITKMLNREFPSIKSYFFPNGEVKNEAYKKRLEKYR